MPVTLSVQRWYESERGWGQSFEGYTVALDPAKHQEILREVRRMEYEVYKGKVPESYIFPDGPSYEIQVTRLDYRHIKALNTKGFFWTVDTEKFGGVKALR